MGAFVRDGYVPHVQAQINSRFAPGDALTEMIGFQKEFKLFSSRHTLQTSLALLGIAPVVEGDREGFYDYVEYLKKTGAQIDGKPTALSGYDQIVATLKKDLESKNPLPVFFTYHAAIDDKPKASVRVISSKKCYAFSDQLFVEISVPTEEIKPRARRKRG